MDLLPFTAKRSDTRLYPAQASDTVIRSPAAGLTRLAGVQAEQVALLTLNTSLSEECATEPTEFATSHEAYAALRLHDGPECRSYLAAHAYVSAGLDD